MTEIELKFQVPPDRRMAVAKAVAAATARTLRLQAHYFDTAERSLAQAGLALRVRKEGRRWVQTLKGAGDGIWQRLEHEVVRVVPSGAVPLADPRLHDGTPAGDALHEVLGDAPLLPSYATEVSRCLRLVRASGCMVELAFDQGALLASGQRWPLCELEFELKGGDPAALVALASRWVTRFGLTLDVRSKAERGDRLARGTRLGEAVKAQPLSLPEAVDSQTALRAVVANCLIQVLGNASEIAHGESSPEHVHQLRVGLRRLRTALRELGGLSPQVRPEWAEALAQLFDRLGALRDRDALAQTLLPALRKAGLPELELPAEVPELDPQIALCETATTQVWLELLAFAAAAAPGDMAFAPRVRQRLAALLRKVRRDAARFAALDDVLRHRLRKRVKRLRYLSEFAASLHRAKDVAAFLRQLGPAQDALGEFNDVCVARALFMRSAASDAHSMFALGWLAHEHDDAIARCTHALAGLRHGKAFW
jgi:triphosphatase